MLPQEEESMRHPRVEMPIAPQVMAEIDRRRARGKDATRDPGMASLDPGEEAARPPAPPETRGAFGSRVRPRLPREVDLDPPLPSARGQGGLVLNWMLALLAAALVVTALGCGIALVYPLLFRA
jgi:hypothetical protein